MVLELIPVLGSQSGCDVWVINPAVGCHYFPPGLQLPSQPVKGLLPIRCLVNWGTMGANSLPKTVTRQRSGCDLNPGPSAPESSTLTTRLYRILSYRNKLLLDRPNYCSRLETEAWSEFFFKFDGWKKNAARYITDVNSLSTHALSFSQHYINQQD